MRRGLVSWGVAVTVLATAANLVHGWAHAGQHVVSLPAWQWVYVTAVVYLAPVCAVVLLTRPRSRRGGAWLLFLSMAGTFGFDLAYHFLLPGPDNVSTLDPGAWRTPFVLSAALVTLLSGLGAVVGATLLLDSPRSPAAGARRDVDLVAPRQGTSTRPR